MIKRVFVTGGCGFVGQAVVTQLLAIPELIVHVIDKEKSPYIESLLPRNPRLYYWETDFADFKFGKFNMATSAIIHLAAETTIPNSYEYPMPYIINNIEKFQDMLKEIAVLGANIVFSSSSSVYGDKAIYNTPEDNITSPTNLYSMTKVTGENLLESYCQNAYTSGVSLRFFNVAGADPDSRYGYRKKNITHLIPAIVNAIITGEDFVLYGTGEAERSFTHVEDIARAHVKALDLVSSFDPEKESYDVLNIGGDQCYSVNDIISVARDMFGIDSLRVISDVARPGDTMLQSANNQKARQVLGWQPQYDIKDMLLDEYNFQKKHGLRKE